MCVCVYRVVFVQLRTKVSLALQRQQANTSTFRIPNHTRPYHTRPDHTIPHQARPGQDRAQQEACRVLCVVYTKQKTTEVCADNANNSGKLLILILEFKSSGTMLQHGDPKQRRRQTPKHCMLEHRYAEVSRCTCTSLVA